ncbi:AAA family ATPase [candidate division WOR-3 bacterium]|nr:AAA family ATPase [candidate division WOR-3 bacterium]
MYKNTIHKGLETDFKNAPTGIWILIGLVGAGKTTFAQKLWTTDPTGTIRSSLDEIIQMMSFYNYEPRMNNFYAGVERSTIVDGLINGYKVIVDRTNITKKTRNLFIVLIKKIKEIANEYLLLLDTQKESTFIEQCERNLIENILIEESRKNITIYSLYLKLVRDWKVKKIEPILFTQNSSTIRNKLKDIAQTEIVGIFFDVPEEICIQRRLGDPLNIVRDRGQKINWKAVIKKMKKQLEQPEINEGFDRIYRVNQNGSESNVLYHPKTKLKPIILNYL